MVRTFFDFGLFFFGHIMENENIPEVPAEPIQDPVPEPVSESEVPGDEQSESEVEEEIEDPGDEQSEELTLIPGSLIDTIKTEIQSKGNDLHNQHKDLVQSVASQVTTHAETIQQLQGHVEQLRDMRTNPKSAFLKAGYQMLQDEAN